MREVPEETLRAIERFFHAIIHERAGELVEQHNLELPKLSVLLTAAESKAWAHREWFGAH